MRLRNAFLNFKNGTEVLFWCLIFAGTCKGFMINNDPNRRGEYLDPEEKYLLEWTVDWGRNRIVLNITVETQGWVMLGLANNNNRMTGKDIVIGGVMGQSGKSYCSDRHEVGGSRPGQPAIVDKSQDYNLQDSWETTGKTFLSFTRELDTCDPEDYSITENKVTVIWGYGDDDNYDNPRWGNSVQRGSYDLYLLEPEYTPRIIRDSRGNPKLVDGSKRNEEYLRWTVSVSRPVPNDHTAYLCTIHKAPRLRQKHHIIGYDVYLPDNQSLEHIHHFVMYRCNAPRGQSARNIFEKYVGAPDESCYHLSQSPPSSNPGRMPFHLCNEFLIAWAIGGRAFFFPPEAGISFGNDPDEYFVIQTHYDNQHYRRNVQVSVRLDMWYTPKLRANDAGLINMGVLLNPLPPTTLVPPQSSNHREFGFCSTECTQRILPQDGVTVFAGLLHSHNSGVGIRLRHFDMEKNVELPWILYDDNYSNKFQQVRHLREKMKLLPGDQISTDCRFDNRWTNGSVLGGFSTSQEMCSGLIYYYSQIRDYSQCRSQFVDEKGRQRFLLGLRNMTWSGDEKDWIALSPRRLAGLTATEIADSVRWDKELRRQLQRYHLEGQQIGSCNRDLFARNRESLRAALIARQNLPSVYPHTRVDTEDDFSAPVGYPFDATPYFPPKKLCPLNRG